LRLSTTLAFIAVLAGALLAAIYWPGLHSGFFFDDLPNIVDNNAVHLKTLNLASLHASIGGPTAGPLGRPVSVLSFALTHYFFGLNPIAFKAVNLVLHAINGVLVAWFAMLLLARLRGTQIIDTANVWLAVWVAAIWLVHPINTTPVLLSVQRMTLLSAMFMLLALIGHLKATVPEQNTRWSLLGTSWLIFWPLAVLSKESGLLFPLFVLTISLFVPRRSVSGSRTNSRMALAAGLLMLATGLAMWSRLGWNWLDSAYAMRSFSLTERLMTEARVLWFYVAQIITPDFTAFGVYLDDFSVSTGLTKPMTTLFAIIGWVIVIAAVVMYRRRQPVLCFGAAWFLVGHSLESTFLPLELVHEYRNYLPSIGLIIGAGYLGSILLARARLDYRIPTICAAAATPVLIVALFTAMRSDQLGDPVRGSQIDAMHHPLSARTNYYAAVLLIQAGYGDKGDPIGAQTIRFHLQQAVKVNPSLKDGYLALIVWACASERPVEKIWIDELANRLEHTPFSPSDLPFPDHLFKQLIAAPTCLSHDDAIRLFAAGAGNSRLPRSMRANFLEMASDYELVVSTNPASAKALLAKATALVPEDVALGRKFKSYSQIK